MVKEMLEAWIIKVSHSLYSSPIILIKKKDGNWGFYVNYRAFNKVTILEKFLITIVK